MSYYSVLKPAYDYNNFSHTKSSTRISKNVWTLVHTQCLGRHGIVIVRVRPLSSGRIFFLPIIIQTIYRHVIADKKSEGGTKSARTRIRLMVSLAKKLVKSWPKLALAQAGFQNDSQQVTKFNLNVELN